MCNRILVAEDEPITRMDICEMLIANGYDVVGAASDGLQAIDLCRKLKPDLVLMDIKMPKLDGIQAAKLILEENLVAALIMLTAYSGKDFVDKVKEIGALGYIVKPIDEIKLIPQIEIAIHKGKEIEEIILKFKAKELLMENFSLSENDAYKKLRRLSMDKQCSLLETSKILIRTYGENIKK